MARSSLPQTTLVNVTDLHGNLYDGYCYSLHINGVMAVAYRYVDQYFTYGNQLINPMVVLMACAYHDVLEDTNLTYNDLCGIVGRDAADIVYAVTNELGKTRKERAERTYPKIRADRAATFVKLCDRIANLQYSIYTFSPTGMINAYVKEDGVFDLALRTDDFKEMWDEYDALIEKGKVLICNSNS